MCFTAQQTANIFFFIFKSAFNFTVKFKLLAYSNFLRATLAISL